MVLLPSQTASPHHFLIHRHLNHRDRTLQTSSPHRRTSPRRPKTRLSSMPSPERYLARRRRRQGGHRRLCDDANEADDKAASMLASIDPEVDSKRSPIEGASGRDCECACRAGSAFTSSASNSSGGRRSFSISDLRLNGDERSSIRMNK